MGEEPVTSKFNAGMLFVGRIDSLQKAINAAQFNRRAFNFDTGTFNFQVEINASNCLLGECWGKLTNDEKITGETIKTTIKNFLRYRPVIIMRRTKGSETPVIDEDNFIVLEELLDTYGKRLKEFLEEHSLNSPNSDWDDSGL